MYNHSDTPNATWYVEGTTADPNSWRVILLLLLVAPELVGLLDGEALVVGL
jgi:hypothetical protein